LSPFDRAEHPRESFAVIHPTTLINGAFRGVHQRSTGLEQTGPAGLNSARISFSVKDTLDIFSPRQEHPTMDSFDSYRSSVPARLPANRSGSPVLRASSGLPEAASHSPLSIRIVLRGARRYWWLVLMLWLVGWAGLSAAIWLKVKPNYKAYSGLKFEPPTSTLFGVGASTETFEMYLQTQVQLITSPNVLTAAAASPKATNLSRIKTAGDVIQELKKVIVVSVVPGTTLLEVSMTSPDTFESAVLVNAVVDSYLATNEEWANSMTKNQIKSLDDYLRDLHGQTDELERQLLAIAASGDVPQMMLDEDKKARQNPNDNGRSKATIDQFMQVKNDILAIELQIAETQSVLDTAKTSVLRANSTPVADGVKKPIDRIIERRFRTDPDVMDLASAMTKTQNKYDEAVRISRNLGDPAVRLAQKRLDSLKKQYNDLWETKSTQWLEDSEMGGPDGALTPEQEVRELTKKLETLNAKRIALKKVSSELDVNTREAATNGVKIQFIQDQRTSLKAMQDAVQRRLEQLRYESRGETRVRKVNEALASSKPISDKRLTYLAVTPVGVLGTVLCLIVLLEIRSGRVADPDVLSSRVKHEVFSIAPLPNLKPGEDINGEKAEQRLARFVQSLDHLRVAICEGHNAGGEGRCVMITSATGGEGKTTLSAHLAARCANSGTSTLLIDADMRRASLGRLLDVPVGPGLGDVLAGDLDLDEALITVQAGGFHFLSAGTPGRDPSRVLKSARLSELIARLRQTYDLVIIDTPPVLPVADALIMGRWADGAVMAARFDASRLPLVERANRQLALAGIPVLGVVVNGVRGQDAAYGNYAYSYNYYPAKDDRSAANPSV
jgi:succinoglycan biosynthesis transport protein ExoP